MARYAARPGDRDRTITWWGVCLGLTTRGEGPPLLMLPALSSISTRHEMAPLAARLRSRFRTLAVDWPGFGDGPRPRRDWSPSMLSTYLAELLDSQAREARSVVAAGHAATYLLAFAAANPGRLSRLVLVAPTWRGPLRTMAGGDRPWFAHVRRALDAPGLGHLLYAANVARPVLRKMAREHVYEDPRRLVGSALRDKSLVARRQGARHASVRFVTGALDPVDSRDAFLELAARADADIFVIYGEGTPRRSRAEMDALANAAGVRSAVLPRGRLAIHEEFPDEVAEVAIPFLTAPSTR